MDTGNYNKNLYEETFCEAKTIIESHSETIRPVGRTGPLMVKMLVVISQTRVHIHIESKIKLDQTAVGIRNCTRNVYLTRCKLLDAGNKKNGKIYMNGFIKESIEYASVADDNEGRIKGDIRYITIKIPFECTAKVEYYLPPSIRGRAGLIPVELFDAGSSADEIASIHWKEGPGNLPHGTNNTERIYCDVEDVRIMEADMVRSDSYSSKQVLCDCMFDTVVEQLSVSITFTLLQKQLVSIPKYLPYSGQY